jgi:hypothetical protein
VRQQIKKHTNIKDNGNNKNKKKTQTFRESLCNDGVNTLVREIGNCGRIE